MTTMIVWFSSARAVISTDVIRRSSSTLATWPASISTFTPCMDLVISMPWSHTRVWLPVWSMRKSVIEHGLFCVAAGRDQERHFVIVFVTERHVTLDLHAG